MLHGSARDSFVFDPPGVWTVGGPARRALPRHRPAVDLVQYGAVNGGAWVWGTTSNIPGTGLISV